MPSWSRGAAATGCGCGGACGGACEDGCRASCGCRVADRLAGTVAPDRVPVLPTERQRVSRDTPGVPGNELEDLTGDEVTGDPPWWARLPQPETLPIDAFGIGEGPWLDKVEGLGAFEFPEGGPCEKPARYCFASSREPRIRSCSDESYKDRVVVHSGCGSSMEELIRASWCLLNDNTDLIRTACCWVSDEADAADRVIERIRRTTFRVDVLCPDTIPASDGGFHCHVGQGIATVTAHGEETLGGGEVTLCLADDRVETPLDLWSQGDDDSRTCAVVVIAAVLFHELLHVCSVEPWVNHELDGEDATDEPDCDPIDFGERVLLWMLLTRYRAAMRSCNCQGAFGNWAGGRPREAYSQGYSMMLLLLATSLIGCEEKPVLPAVDCGPYVPTGSYVSLPEECGSETCPIICAGNWCGASIDGFYCEWCDRWEEFKASADCPSCQSSEHGGAETLNCNTH